jgi:pyrroloquinoline quinone biosynthesis protein B
MLVRILGAAAGGGLPQWNCGCSGCQAVRKGTILPLTQSSIAVQAAGEPWFLINASPDVRQQLERLRNGLPTTIRSSPIAAVLLTDAEIDHTAGLMILRESSQPLKVYSTITVKKALSEGFPILRTLASYCGIVWSALESGSSVTLSTGESSGLEVEVFPLSNKPPKYMPHLGDDEIWAVGLTFRDYTTGGIVTYAPVLSELTETLLQRFESSDCILVDGTFWRNDELVSLSISTRTARAMGHLPLAGSEGSLQQLKLLKRPRKILIHINNTNPIHQPDSLERQNVEAAGLEVAYDGMILDL